MILNRMEIRGLFGTFHYDIDFERASNPFVITGLNGYGKTTILSIIDSIAKKNPYYFYTLPFSSIDMYFADGCLLKIVSRNVGGEQQIGADLMKESMEADPRKEPMKVVEFDLTRDGESVKSATFGGECIDKVLANFRFRYGSRFGEIPPNEFYKELNEEVYTRFLDEVDKNINALFMMLNSLSTTFIGAQRIFVADSVHYDKGEYFFQRVERPSRKYMVEEIAKEIGETLEKERNKYLKSAQEIDGKLLEQLLEDKECLSSTEYVELKRGLDLKIEELVSFGLLDTIVIRDYDEQHSRELSVYIRNLESKLNVYDTLLDKLRLFDNLISSLEFIHKRVSFSSRGIKVCADDGKIIDVKKLSSGEQNEIVMLYYMIFKVPDSKVLLIDEPEISLHVRWQKDFLNNLSRVAEAKNLQVVVATHSPQIVGGRWKECYDLCERLIAE